MERKVYKQGYQLEPLLPSKSISPLEDEKNVFFRPRRREEKTRKGDAIRDTKKKSHFRETHN